MQNTPDAARRGATPSPAAAAPHVPDVSPDLPPASWRLVLAALRRLPQGALSRAFGRIADVAIPRALRRPVLGTAARVLGIDLAEAERPVEDYPSLNALFVRRLRPGARRWPQRPDLAGSPVDGVIGAFGQVRDGRLIQAKGRWYSAADLLGDPVEGRRYDGGAFLTLYLSPRHYHRIHAPCDGAIPTARYVPGALFPVNTPAVLHIQDLFARNERLVCPLDGPLGRVTVVAVGAYNVGRISAAFDPAWCAGPGGAHWVTNRRPPAEAVRTYDPPVAVSAGAEIMAFHLGSTVILLFEPGRARLAADLRTGAEIRLGDPVAERAGDA
ncbi:MAG TPA: archaetidylserine decarboxylase [Longimicrobiales bacterium]